MPWRRPETASRWPRLTSSSVGKETCWAPAPVREWINPKLLRVLRDADLIAQARTLAEQCIAQDAELSDPRLADIVLDVEMDAAGDWLERG